MAVDSTSKSRSLEVSLELVPILDIAEFIRTDRVEREDGKSGGIEVGHGLLLSSPFTFDRDCRKCSKPHQTLQTFRRPYIK